MGVTISNRLSQRKIYVKSTLDNAQRVAEAIKTEQADKLGVPFKIRREDDFCLLVDIGNCETLAFDFKSVAEIEKEREQGWSYIHAVLTDDGKNKLDEGYMVETYPQNEISYSASFCKTQFSKTLIEHKWCADITRVVASRCLTASVSDDGDYYHSGTLEDAAEAIAENGALINSLGATLAGLGYEAIKGGETQIKPSKKKG